MFSRPFRLRKRAAACLVVFVAAAVTGSKIGASPGLRPPSPIDWRRLDTISEVAKRVPVGSTWDAVADALGAAEARAVGPLSALDRYWAASAWWAAHQPVEHVDWVPWADQAARDPQSILNHLDDPGNCVTSATGHIALLRRLGVAATKVSGLDQCGRGHRWVRCEVGGMSLFADVHNARMHPFDRETDAPWRPSPHEIEVQPTLLGVLDFLQWHHPYEDADQGLPSPLSDEQYARWPTTVRPVQERLRRERSAASMSDVPVDMSKVEVADGRSLRYPVQAVSGVPPGAVVGARLYRIPAQGAPFPPYEANWLSPSARGDTLTWDVTQGHSLSPGVYRVVFLASPAADYRRGTPHWRPFRRQTIEYGQ